MKPTIEQRLAVRIRPKSPHVMYQSWRDLLFLHWAVDPDLIQRTLPDGLTVDTWDNRAYIGLVPFYMRGIRPRFLPPVPGISWFLEYNVRTYVYDKNGTPGVWFYSLDCNQPLAVWLARWLFRLPYHHAKMNASPRSPKAGRVDYRSWRKGIPENSASHFDYSPIGMPKPAVVDTLEFFLSERYILFADTKRGLASGQVHHAPYEMCSAEITNWDSNILPHNDLPLLQRPPDSALYSPGVKVDVYPLKQL